MNGQTEFDPYDTSVVINKQGQNIGFDPYDVSADILTNKKSSEDVSDSPWQSFKNQLSNAFEFVGNIPEFWGITPKTREELLESEELGGGSGLSIANTLIWEGIFGRETIKEWRESAEDSKLGKVLDSKLAKTLGKSPGVVGLFTKGFSPSDTENFIKTVENFEKEKQKMKPTMTFKQANSLLDYMSVVAGAIVNAGGSVAYNMGTGGTGFFFDFAAENFIEANKIKAESKGISLEELLQNNDADVATPIKIAAFQAGLEYFGFRKIMKPLKGTGISKAYNKQVSNFLTKKYKLNKSVRVGLDVLSTGKTESLTEMGQYGLEYYNSELAKAKAENKEINPLLTITKGMFSEEGIESGLQGFFGGGGLRGGTYSAKALGHIRKTNSDIDVEADLNNLINLRRKFNQTKDEDIKNGVKEKIDDLEISLNNKIKKGNDIYQSLTNKDISKIESLGDLADVTAYRATQLNKKLANNEISEEDYTLALEGLASKYKKNKQSIKDIILNRNIDFAKKEGKKLGKNVDVVDDTQNFQKIYEEVVPENQIERDDDGNIVNVENRDGFIFGDQIYINKAVAREKGAISVGSHELLHGIIGNSFTSLDTKDRIKLGKSFISVLNAEQEAAVRKRLKESYGLEGDAVFESEEMFTVFSDAIAKNEISFNENIFSQLKNAIQEILRKFGINKEFENGRQAYNFLKEYNENIKKGKLSERVTSFAEKQDKSTIAKESRSTPLESINELIPESVKTQEDYYALLDDPKVAQRILDIKGNLAPVIEAYIRSRSTSSEMATENIEAVKDRLVNFDPAAEREDGSIVGPEGFGEFIFANARFGKMVAAKKLAVEGEKRKKTTRLDDPDVKDIPDDTPTPTTQVEDKTKKTVIAKRLGITKEVANAINKIVPNLDINKLNFKTLKNQIPEITGKLFGISTKKIEDLSNLSKPELQKAQMFISKNAPLLIAMLPKGATISGTSTGVPNTLLAAFYTKTAKAKLTKTGSRAGLPIQVKNKNITPKKFLETFGIIDGKPMRDDRNTSARVLALANLTGKMITNQAVRQELGQTNAKVTKAISKIKEGKSDIMFSKSGGNKVLEKSGLKPVSNKNVNDRVIFKTFIEEYLPLFVPIPRQKNGKFRLPSDTYGPNSKIAPGYYITRFERVISAVRAGNVQLANKIYTKKQINQINKAYSVVKFDESQKEINTRREGAELFIKGLNKAVNSEKGNKQNLRPIQMLLSSTPNGTYHIIRMIAPGLGTTNVGKRTKSIRR